MPIGVAGVIARRFFAEMGRVNGRESCLEVAERVGLEVDTTAMVVLLAASNVCTKDALIELARNTNDPLAIGVALDCSSEGLLDLKREAMTQEIKQAS